LIHADILACWPKKSFIPAAKYKADGGPKTAHKAPNPLFSENYRNFNGFFWQKLPCNLHLYAKSKNSPFMLRNHSSDYKKTDYRMVTLIVVAVLIVLVNLINAIPLIF
jgi:hypothetical protein